MSDLIRGSFGSSARNSISENSSSCLATLGSLKVVASVFMHQLAQESMNVCVSSLYSPSAGLTTWEACSTQETP